MTEPTDWTPGALALGFAATLGVLAALRVLRKGRPVGEVAEPSRLGELTRQRDALYEQIRALDGDPGWRPDDRAEARHRLVIEAATTLRAIEAAEAAPAAAPRAPVARSPWVSAAIGGAAGVFGAGLVLGIQNYTKDAPVMAPAAAPMDAATGPGSTCPTMIAAAKSAAEAAPDDIHARLVYARTLMDCGDMKGAFDQTQAVTEKHPDDPDTRTLQAVILLQIGDVEMAAGLLDKVLSLHPENVEALGYRGAIYLNAGQKEEAIAAWEKVIALDPTQAPAVAPLIEMAKTGKNPFGSAPVTGGASGTAAPMASGGAPAEPSAQDITGTITSAAAAPYLFVYLRPAGQDRGPPAAVKRFENPTFPLSFRVGPADSPMGGPFPADGTLTVRVDLDGNPTTHEDGAPETRVEHVKPGQADLAIGL